MQTTNEFATTGRVESVLTPRLSTTQRKRHCSIELLLAYAQPLEQLQLLQYYKFQMAKTVVKAS